MILEELEDSISGSTAGWNYEFEKVINSLNTYMEMTTTGLFSIDSPLFTVKLTDKQLRKEFKKLRRKNGR